MNDKPYRLTVTRLTVCLFCFVIGAATICIFSPLHHPTVFWPRFIAFIFGTAAIGASVGGLFRRSVLGAVAFSLATSTFVLLFATAIGYFKYMPK